MGQSELVIIKLAQIAGAKVIAIDMNGQRLKFAKDQIGVDYILKAGDGTIEQEEKLLMGTYVMLFLMPQVINLL